MSGVPGRELALDLFERTRAEWLTMLRDGARRLYQQHGQPLSTNDVRHLLQGYTGDPRILGAVFRGWTPVGWTVVKSKANARPIRLFVP